MGDPLKTRSYGDTTGILFWVVIIKKINYLTNSVGLKGHLTKKGVKGDLSQRKNQAQSVHSFPFILCISILKQSYFTLEDLSYVENLYKCFSFHLAIKK
jgi:hypothetical protein